MTLQMNQDNSDLLPLKNAELYALATHNKK